MEKDTFKEKVQSMTGKEILLAMINGLKKEHVKIDMNTFGSKKEGICYGCAATNAVCEISSIDFKELPERSIESIIDQAKFIKTDPEFLAQFEYAIDDLRAGDIDRYNSRAIYHGFAQIINPENKELPYLDTDNWKERIIAYEELAEKS